jgi:hypothetical protein
VRGSSLVVLRSGVSAGRLRRTGNFAYDTIPAFRVIVRKEPDALKCRFFGAYGKRRSLQPPGVYARIIFAFGKFPLIRRLHEKHKSIELEDLDSGEEGSPPSSDAFRGRSASHAGLRGIAAAADG